MHSAKNAMVTATKIRSAMGPLLLQHACHHCGFDTLGKTPTAVSSSPAKCKVGSRTPCKVQDHARPRPTIATNCSGVPTFPPVVVRAATAICKTARRWARDAPGSARLTCAKQVEQRKVWRSGIDAKLAALGVDDEVELFELHLSQERRCAGRCDQCVANHLSPEHLEPHAANPRDLFDASVRIAHLAHALVGEAKRGHDVGRKKEHGRAGVDQRLDLHRPHDLDGRHSSPGDLKIGVVRQLDVRVHAAHLFSTYHSTSSALGLREKLLTHSTTPHDSRPSSGTRIECRAIASDARLW